MFLVEERACAKAPSQNKESVCVCVRNHKTSALEQWLEQGPLYSLCSQDFSFVYETHSYHIKIKMTFLKIYFKIAI